MASDSKSIGADGSFLEGTVEQLGRSMLEQILGEVAAPAASASLAHGGSKIDPGRPTAWQGAIDVLGQQQAYKAAIDLCRVDVIDPYMGSVPTSAFAVPAPAA